MKLSIVVFAFMAAISAVAAQKTSWGGKEVTLSTPSSQHQGFSNVEITIKDKKAIKKKILFTDLDEIGNFHFLKSRYLEIVFSSYRSIYWVRVTKSVEVKIMTPPWQADCAILAAGNNTLLIGVKPLGENRKRYYFYDRKDSRWIKMMGID